jgi:pimeloyl-ACP methyl ester carboxylesterase
MYMRLSKIILLLFTLAVSVLAPAAPGRRDPVKKPFPDSRFMEIDGLRLHYRTWAPAAAADTLPWVLMAHGMGGSTFSWERNAPALAAAGFHVVAVDVPPFGFSDKNPDVNQSPDARAELLWIFLEGLKPGSRWHLVGHSMGGGIVQCMAILNPGSVDRVVFSDPALLGKSGEMPMASMPLMKFQPLQWLFTGIGKVFLIREKNIRKFLTSAYSAEPDSADVAEYYRALKQPGTAKALIRSMAVSKPVIRINGLDFNTPAIAIWGNLDSWVPLEKSKPLLEKLPSIKTAVIEGAGHCPMATHPDRFNLLLINFLSLKQ